MTMGPIVSTVRKQREVNAVLLSLQFGNNPGKGATCIQSGGQVVKHLTSVNLAMPSQVYPEIGLLDNPSSVKVTY